MRRTLALAFALSTSVLFAGLAAAETWTVPGDFATIQEAIDAASAGDTIRVGPGTFVGGILDKQLTIKGHGQALINDGPDTSSGITIGLWLGPGSDGSTISRLRFADLELPVYARASDQVTDISVSHCRMVRAVQAISAWGATGWDISHNKIEGLETRNGGGIGILVADSSGGIVGENVVSHNTVQGTLFVDPDDGGGYVGVGIVLFADFRGSRDGAEAISQNLVRKNRVSLVSDTPEVVDVVAFEMTDTQDTLPDPYCDDPVLFDNSVGFNDWRGTEMQMSLNPEELADCNWISRNLGNNRGQGLHPRLLR